MLKPITFGSIIFLGYLFHRYGIFGEDAQKIISRLVLNVTLPVAVVHAFYGFDNDPSMYLLVLFGFCCSFLAFLLTYLLSVREKKMNRMFLMLNCSGYNIGCFALPLIQGLFGPTGAVAACMFDTGNAVMMTGGSYALTTSWLGIEPQGERTPMWKKFLTSAPFDAYMLMLILSAVGFEVPKLLDEYIEPVAQANSFLAMLMLGLLIKPVTEPERLRELAKAVGLRLLYAACFSFLFYRFAPFSEEIRTVLAVTVFAPVSALAPVYTEKCGGDSALAGFVTSVAIIIGLVVMSVLAAVL